MIRVATAVGGAEKADDYYAHMKTLEKQGARIAADVESGKVDPITGELMMETLTSDGLPTRLAQADRVSEGATAALARLVEARALDPIAAENMLDAGFRQFSFLKAVDIQVKSGKQD